MSCTVPVPIPSDLALPTPFASCFRTIPFGHAVYLRAAEPLLLHWRLTVQ
jgi:hypothetical protein